MEKLTLSIKEKEIIEWAKEYAKENETSVSAIIESYLTSLREFDRREVVLSEKLMGLRDIGNRPTEKEIQIHLNQRRKRKSNQ